MDQNPVPRDSAFRPYVNPNKVLNVHLAMLLGASLPLGAGTPPTPTVNDDPKLPEARVFRCAYTFYLHEMAGKCDKNQRIFRQAENQWRHMSKEEKQPFVEGRLKKNEEALELIREGKAIRAPNRKGNRKGRRADKNQIGDKIE